MLDLPEPGIKPMSPAVQTNSYPLYFQESPSPSSSTQSRWPLQRCHSSLSSHSSYQPRSVPNLWKHQTSLFSDAFSPSYLLHCPYLPALLHKLHLSFKPLSKPAPLYSLPYFGFCPRAISNQLFTVSNIAFYMCVCKYIHLCIYQVLRLYVHFPLLCRPAFLFL